MKNLFAILFLTLASCSMFKKSRISEISPVPNDTISQVVDSLTYEETDSMLYAEIEYDMAKLIKVGSPPPPLQQLSAVAKSKRKNEINEPVPNNSGKLLYSIPDTMIVGKSYMLVLRIANSHTYSSITTGVEKRKKSVIDIKIASSMEVAIIDPNSSFSIVKNNNDVQMIDSVEYTEWIYNVTPLKSGRQVLNIVVSSVNKNGKKDRVYFNDVYVISNPAVSAKKFWDSEWKWLFTTFIVPIIIYFYKKKKKNVPDESV